MIRRSEANPIRRLFCITVLLASATTATVASAATPTAATQASGVLRVASTHNVEETVARIKQSVEAKGIRYFIAIDQQQLGASANLPIRKSTLVLFGNPPLGVQFITSEPQAGLDWPVRLLVQEDESGQVWARYTDFDWIARRHRVKNREQAFKTAAGVIASITASVATR